MLTNPLLTEGRVEPFGSTLILSSLVFPGRVLWVLLPLCRCSISVCVFNVWISYLIDILNMSTDERGEYIFEGLYV